MLKMIPEISYIIYVCSDQSVVSVMTGQNRKLW